MRVGFRLGEPANEPSPLARGVGAAKLGEAGEELVPGEDGEASRTLVLENRNERAGVMDG
jgi:hypothetical protein